MKINREDFARAVGRVASLVKTRTTMPIMGTVKLRAQNGCLRIVACNGESFVESSPICKGDLDPCCVAPGPLLALSGYGPETIELTLEKERLRVVSASNSSLSVMTADEFPKWPEDDLKELGVNAADFAWCILAVAWAASNKPDRGIEKQTVWIGMDTKKHSLEAGCMDGRRVGYVKKWAIVPNAEIYLMAENAKLVCEALAENGPGIKYNDNWLVVRGEMFACAIQQVPKFSFPSRLLMDAKSKADASGTIPREATMQALQSMQSVANGEPYVYGNATLLPEGFKLDFVGRNNEFHSCLGTEVAATHSKALQTSGETTPNVAGAKSDNAQSSHAQSPRAVSLDASLLHNVLKNTPGETVKYACGERAIFFENGDLLTGLALVTPP